MIIGKIGSGKSTLLKSICGVLFNNNNNGVSINGTISYLS